MASWRTCILCHREFGTFGNPYARVCEKCRAIDTVELRLRRMEERIAFLESGTDPQSHGRYQNLVDVCRQYVGDFDGNYCAAISDYLREIDKEGVIDG